MSRNWVRFGTSGIIIMEKDVGAYRILANLVGQDDSSQFEVNKLHLSASINVGFMYFTESFDD